MTDTNHDPFWDRDFFVFTAYHQDENNFRFLANPDQVHFDCYLAGLGASPGKLSSANRGLGSNQETEGYRLLSSRSWR